MCNRATRSIFTLLLGYFVFSSACAMHESPHQIMARARQLRQEQLVTERCVAGSFIAAGLICPLLGCLGEPATFGVGGITLIAYGLSLFVQPERKPCVGMHELCNYLCRLESHVHGYASPQDLKKGLVYLRETRTQLDKIFASGEVDEVDRQMIERAQTRCERLRDTISEILGRRAVRKALENIYKEPRYHLIRGGIAE